MEASIRSFPPTRLLAIRHVGPYPMIGAAFERLFGLVHEHQVPVAGPSLGVFHDDPGSVAPEQLRSDACVMVAKEFSTPIEGTHVIDTDGQGEYLVVTHVGSYAGLPAAWQAAMGPVLSGTGRSERDGLCFEVYLDEMGQVPEAELRTEIWIPVA